MRNEEISAAYDRDYAKPNFFGDRPWLFRPLVHAIIARTGLAKGSRVLDAGCGQGFFSSLFAEAGMDVLGVDLSEVGIEKAKKQYGNGAVRFEVGDILALPYERQFDLVFTRSLSLYNVDDFGTNRRVTEQLLRYVADGGVFVFDYHTKLASRKQAESKGWRYHSLAAARNHFHEYVDARVAFSWRLETMLLAGLSFAPTVTFVAATLSRVTGTGGELIAIVPARHASSTHSPAVQGAESGSTQDMRKSDRD